jgi:hypothetical protein
MPNKKVNPDTLARLEAAANRRRLAATTPQERCLAALALVAIRGYRRQVEANSGEGATTVASSPVGASGIVPAAPPPYPRPGLPKQRAGDSLVVEPVDLDPVTLPPEIPTLAGSAAASARRTGQRA